MAACRGLTVSYTESIFPIHIGILDGIHLTHPLGLHFGKFSGYNPIYALLRNVWCYFVDSIIRQKMGSVKTLCGGNMEPSGCVAGCPGPRGPLQTKSAGHLANARHFLFVADPLGQDSLQRNRKVPFSLRKVS